jgi:uncharacterized membrane protein YjjP (DUF1212 family)
MTIPDPGFQRRLRRIRRRVDHVLADQDPPTLIDSPPPLELWDARHPLAAPVDAERQRTFDFAQRVGAIMLARGASVDDVEASVRAAAMALGLPRPEVDVTFTSIIVSVRPDPGQPPLTSVGVVHQRSDDHSRLLATHKLLLELSAGTLSREEAFEKLAAIEDQPHPYGRNIVTLARGVLAGAIVFQLGGNWSAAVVVATVAVLIDLLGRWLAARRVPVFYLNVVGGLVATLAAASTTALGVHQSPSLVVAGSIVVLLPGATLVNGVRDGLSGYYVTGTARVFEVFVLVGGLVAGVALGLTPSRALGVDMSLIPDGVGLDALPIRIITAVIAGLAGAIAYYAPYRLLPAIAVSGGLGMLCLGLVQESGVAGVVPYPLAAFVIGLSGYLFAHVQRALPMMVVVPAIVSLLPGLLIYSGLLQLVGGDAFNGIVSLVLAGARGLAIAAAVLVAELIGQPVRRRMMHRA